MALEFKALFNEASARLRELDDVLRSNRNAVLVLSTDLTERIIPELAEHDEEIAQSVKVELLRRLRPSRGPRKCATQRLSDRP